MSWFQKFVLYSVTCAVFALYLMTGVGIYFAHAKYREWEATIALAKKFAPITTKKWWWE